MMMRIFRKLESAPHFKLAAFGLVLFDGRFGTGTRRRWRSTARAELHTLNAGGDGAADESVEPMIVAAFGAQLPFVHRAAPPLGLHPVFGRQMVGEQPMLIGPIAKQ